MAAERKSSRNNFWLLSKESSLRLESPTQARHLTLLEMSLSVL